jgi:hypothetical protein
MPSSTLSTLLRSPWVRLALVLLALSAPAAATALLAPGASPSRAGPGPWSEVRIGR